MNLFKMLSKFTSTYNKDMYDVCREILIDLRKLWINNPECRDNELKTRILIYRSKLERFQNTIKGNKWL